MKLFLRLITDDRKRTLLDINDIRYIQESEEEGKTYIYLKNSTEYFHVDMNYEDIELQLSRYIQYFA